MTTSCAFPLVPAPLEDYAVQFNPALHSPAQRLQFFLSEANWDAEAVNAQRLALLAEQPALAARSGGVLVLG